MINFSDVPPINYPHKSQGELRPLLQESIPDELPEDASPLILEGCLQAWGFRISQPGIFAEVIDMFLKAVKMKVEVDLIVLKKSSEW